MKKLTLVRHAKSSWKDPSLNDFDRPLNKRGKRDLPAMAERLHQFDIKPDLIISSGANRALTTAQAIKTRLGVTQEQFSIQPELYESCSETLLYVLQNQNNTPQHIMLVGHNPGLEMLGFYLTQEHLEKFPTAAVIHMYLSVTRWDELAEGCATLTLFDYPKKHQAENNQDS